MHQPQSSSNTGDLSKLGSAKLLGGFGAIFLLLSLLLMIVPVVGAVFKFIALVLFFFAALSASGAFNDSGLVVKMAIVVATDIIIVLLIVVFAASLFDAMKSFDIGTIQDSMKGIMGTIVLWVILAIVDAILLTIFFNRLGSMTNVSSLKTGGTLYIIGFCLRIIVVGFILELVAYIFLIVGFFNISPDNVKQPQQVVMAVPGQQVVYQNTAPAMHATTV
ncbi:hypothetical protein P9112_003337 [Eukaryota sp. TZLM1-RC]